MAYRNKDKYILKLNPDIVVVPECENMGEQRLKRLWFGDNQKKGLGIFSYSAFELELHSNYNSAFKYVIPIKVSGPIEFDLLAIWAKNDLNDIRKRYIGQIWLAINYYKEILDKPLIIVGDFNWNTKQT
jgi:exodeoxyribonuclease-3